MAEWRIVTVPLDYPLGPDRLGEGATTISEVRLSAPDLDALEAIEEASAAPGALRTRETRAIIVALSNLSEAEVGKLHGRDVRRIGDAATPFLEDLQEPS